MKYNKLANFFKLKILIVCSYIIMYTKIITLAINLTLYKFVSIRHY